jgi:hypothetical protein
VTSGERKKEAKMKKSLLLTLTAVFAVLIFASGCKKEENANTDTAATDTGITSSSTTGTTTTSSTSTTGTEMTSTETTGTAGAMGTMSTMGTTGTETSGTMAPGKKAVKKDGGPTKKTKKY